MVLYNADALYSWAFAKKIICRFLLWVILLTPPKFCTIRYIDSFAYILFKMVLLQWLILWICTNYAYRVEYTDSFGRSRKCLRKDLPELEKNDNQLMSKRERWRKVVYYIYMKLFNFLLKVSCTRLDVWGHEKGNRKTEMGRGRLWGTKLRNWPSPLSRCST